MVRQCECSHDKFNVIKQIDNIIKLQYTVLNNYYLKDNGGVLKVEYGDNNNLFQLIEHSDKTYTIKSVTSGLAVTVNEDSTLSLSTYNENNESQHFLFERMENSLFIESSAEYTADGRFIKSVKDSLGNVATYDINSITGVTNSITDPLDNTTNYTYDSKFRVSNISKGEHNVSYEYTNNNLSKISHGTKNYTFEYDNFNNNKKININNTNLVENTYEENNGNITKIKYGNNHETFYTYDEFDRVKTITKTNDVYRNYYDNLGRIVKLVSNNDSYNYEYDFANRLSKYKFNGYMSSYNYDSENNITDKTEKLGNNSYTYSYTYNQESSLTNLNVLNNNFNYHYDNLGRIIESNINDNYIINYSYITNGKKTSTVLSNVNDNGIDYSYKYDKLGNIIEIKKDNLVVNQYFYDEHSQLIKEHNLVNNQTIEYSYDNYGNILSKKVYTYNTNTLLSENTYSYENSNWQDLLTKFNNESITYDNIGNPLTIGNKTLAWMNGRELSTYNDGTNIINYKYNLNGIRTSKIVNNIETKYFIEGSKIVFEDRNGTYIYYIYSNDELVGFKYNESVYYYRKNIFDDIIGILNSNYEEIVTYEYDSWGAVSNIIDTSGLNLSIINPFRYRSYYYDEETMWYYINSRYYNPEWGRFINGDMYISTGQGSNGCNMFVYCGNNYINRFENGNSWLSSIGKSIKNGAKKVKKTVVGAFNKTKETVNKGVKKIKNTYNSAKKKINNFIDNAEKKLDSFKKSFKEKFVFEWGTGVGIKANISEVIEGGFATTFGSTYNNGKWNDYDRFSAEGTLGLSENKEVGLKKESTHYNNSCDSDDYFMNIPNIVSSNCSEQSTTIGIKNKKTQATIEGNFVGISFDFYFIVGFDFKIGFML